MPGQASKACRVLRRETTALQRKLEALAGRISNFGLAAALFALAAMAGQFSWTTFFVQHAPWDPAYLSTYLRFVITAITILARPPAVATPHSLTASSACPSRIGNCSRASKATKRVRPSGDERPPHQRRGLPLRSRSLRLFQTALPDGCLTSTQRSSCERAVLNAPAQLLLKLCDLLTPPSSTTHQGAEHVSTEPNQSMRSLEHSPRACRRQRWL